MCFKTKDVGLRLNGLRKWFVPNMTVLKKLGKQTACDKI